MTKLALLVCGSRRWGIVPPDLPAAEHQAAVLRARAERERTLREIAALAPTHLIHGAANGADKTAAECFIDWALVENRGAICTPFRADWSLGPAAGPMRNSRMLREGKPDRGIAFGALWRFDAREDRSLGVVAGRWKLTGTGDMVQKMLRARLPVRWVETAEAPALDLTEMPGPPR